MEDIEPRKDFYSKEINIERMESVLNYVISTLNLAEILKMIREISYDMVSYYDSETCSKIYKDDSYSEQNRWEANQRFRSHRIRESIIFYLFIFSTNRTVV